MDGLVLTAGPGEVSGAETSSVQGEVGGGGKNN